jgi:hypothetical protein
MRSGWWRQARTVTAYDARLKRAGAALTRPDGTVAPVQSGLPPVAFNALMIADSGQVAAAFTGPLSQFGAKPGTVLLLGTELWNNEPGLARVPAMRGALFAAVPDARFQSLAARYRTRFGAQPTRLASLAYDAVLLRGFRARPLADRQRLSAGPAERSGGLRRHRRHFPLPRQRGGAWAGGAARGCERIRYGVAGAVIVLGRAGRAAWRQLRSNPAESRRLQARARPAEGG